MHTTILSIITNTTTTDQTRIFARTVKVFHQPDSSASCFSLDHTALDSFLNLFCLNVVLKRLGARLSSSDVLSDIIERHPISRSRLWRMAIELCSSSYRERCECKNVYVLPCKLAPNSDCATLCIE